MSKTAPNIFPQMSPKKRKKHIDRWFILSLIFIGLGLALALFAITIALQ